MDFQDYYKILSVAPDADSKTIKTAYRKLARKYHPDVSAQSEAEEKFKQISEAYDVLKDPQKRAQYDELREYGAQSHDGSRRQYSQSYSKQSDFSDFFYSIFGDPRRAGHEASRKRASRTRAFLRTVLLTKDKISKPICQFFSKIR